MMEQLQEGYVASVAATAGCVVEPIRRQVWGFDAWIIRPPSRIGEEETKLAVQLKNTTRLKPDTQKSTFSYQFKDRKYFDALSGWRLKDKAVCIVMATPPKQLDWTVADHECLLTQHCCYWVNLEGYKADTSTQYPTVPIPLSNIFDAPALQAIMDRLERGEAP